MINDSNHPQSGDAILDKLRASGLTIDGDNAYKRDLLDAVVGAMLVGRQNTNQPPADHWAQRFWDIGREYGALPSDAPAIVLPMPVMPEQPEDAIDDSWMDGYNAAGRMREDCMRAIEAAGLADPAVVNQQLTTAELTNIRCQCCQAEHAADSYDAGFIAGSGMCQACDAAIPATDIHTSAARDILAERQRQVTSEDFDASHDDMATRGQLSAAAGCYAFASQAVVLGHPKFPAAPPIWPWDKAWWKPCEPRQMLIKAGALILAEIERIDRAQAGRVLRAYQVGDNDIVAAYDPAGAIKVLSDFAGYGDDFDESEVDLVSDKMLDNTEAFDIDEGKTITLEKTLRQELAELTEPAYLHGWE